MYRWSIFFPFLAVVLLGLTVGARAKPEDSGSVRAAGRKPGQEGGTWSTAPRKRRFADLSPHEVSRLQKGIREGVNPRWTRGAGLLEREEAGSSGRAANLSARLCSGQTTEGWHARE
jgi:hypothetical protein